MNNKIVNISGLAIFLLVLSPSTVIACSCANYYDNQRDMPTWVTSDQIKNNHYMTSGSTLCTGLKPIDEKRATQKAREALAFMLNSDIQAVETVSNITTDTVSHSDFRRKAKINTEQLIKNGVIYDRWVDVINCTVYSAIKISETNIIEAEKHKKQTITAIPSCVKTTGAYSSIMREKLTERLSQHNLNLVPNNKCRIEYRVANKLTETNKDMVKTKLTLSIFDTKKQYSILEKSYIGKGLSFSNTGKAKLVSFAIEDSLDNFTNDLQKIKQKRVN